MPTLRRYPAALLLLAISARLLLLPAAASALPDPASLEPTLLFPSTGAAAAASQTQPQTPAAGGSTIPAFPEQSEAAASTSVCQLAPSPPLLPAVLVSCNADAGGSGGALPPRLRCCPALAAWLYAAYAPTALSGPGAGGEPAAAVAASAEAAAVVDMPVLPDDAEECAGAADRALRAAGAALPRPQPRGGSAGGAGNGTAACDVAFCYCGVRLRRPLCPAPEGRMARRLERDCALPGISGCSRCLRALNKVTDTRELSSPIPLDWMLLVCCIGLGQGLCAVMVLPNCHLFLMGNARLFAFIMLNC